jgi:DNA-binding protein Fis
VREETDLFKQKLFIPEEVKERSAVIGDLGRSKEQDPFNKEILDFFVEFFCRKKPVFLKDLMDQIEKCVIYRVLCMTRGNQIQAAKALGIKYTTLNVKVKKHGIRFQKIPVGNVY